jgi:hypothetical protein
MSADVAGYSRLIGKEAPKPNSAHHPKAKRRDRDVALLHKCAPCFVEVRG